MARRKVRDTTTGRQLPLPGFEARLAAVTTVEPVGPDWETDCLAAGCRYGREVAVAHLATLEAALHEARPAGYASLGWRERTVMTRVRMSRCAG